MINIIFKVHIDKIPILLFFMDSEKAFDLREWTFLKAVLD